MISDKPRIEVILRTHSTGNVHSGRRVVDEFGSRNELTKRSLRSLINALMVLEQTSLAQLRLTVLDDHSDEESVQYLRTSLAACPFATEFISLPTAGNGPSLRAAYERGRASAADLLFFAEDDYLHEPTALFEMLLTYCSFSQNLNRKEVGLFPVDYGDRYTEGILPSRIVLGSHRHWRTVQSTTGTFFIPRKTLEDQWQWFMLFSEHVVEEANLNNVWKNHTIMFSPIPTLAYHLHEENILPPFTDWKKLWDSVAV